MSVDSVRSSSSSDRHNYVSDRNRTKDTSKTNSTKKTDKTKDVDKSKKSNSTDKSKEIDTKDKIEVSNESEDNKNSETKNMDMGAKAQADRILGSITSSFGDVKSNLSKTKTASEQFSNSDTSAGAALERHNVNKTAKEFGIKDIDEADDTVKNNINEIAGDETKNQQDVLKGTSKAIGLTTNVMSLDSDVDSYNNAQSEDEKTKANVHIAKDTYNIGKNVNDIGKDSLKIFEKEAGEGALKEAGEGALKEAGEGALKEAGEGALKEAGEGALKATGKGALKVADRVISPAVSAYDGYHEAKDVAKKENLTGVDKRRLEISGAAGAVVGDIAASLVGGAIAGSVVPGPGTVVGAVAGLGIGIAASTFGSKAGMSLGIDAGLKEAKHHKYEEIGNRMGEDAAKQAERILAEYNRK